MIFSSSVIRLLFILIIWFSAQQPTPEEPVIVISPMPGAVMQGIFPISATIRIDEIKSYEISFSYQRNQTAWFPISRGTKINPDGNLAFWDTNTIADGIYQLKISATKMDGKLFEVIIPNLRVRNYTPIETSTPTQASISMSESTPTPKPVRIIKPVIPTMTPFPENPAILTDQNYFSSVGIGIGGVVIIIILYIVFTLLKNR